MENDPLAFVYLTEFSVNTPYIKSLKKFILQLFLYSLTINNSVKKRGD